MPRAVSPTYIRYMRDEANETQNLKPENEDSH